MKYVPLLLVIFLIDLGAEDQMGSFYSTQSDVSQKYLGSDRLYSQGTNLTAGIAGKSTVQAVYIWNLLRQGDRRKSK